jgi:aquaporin Z
MVEALRSHWPEYLMEASELGLFMLSACSFTVLLEHPSSPARQALPSDFLRRALAGLAMGVTSFSLVHSPMGKRSGAHMNPSFTLMFFRLKKIAGWDAAFYVVGQFLGGFLGVVFAWFIFGAALAHGKVNYAATLPGASGVPVAFFAELLVSFLLAFTVLWVSNHRRLSRFTPYFSAALVALYITLEAPFSGMSMNPARTLGSALLPRAFHALWIYFVAPPVGMLLASQLYLGLRSASEVYCAKFHHHNSARCIFRCRFCDLLIPRESTKRI